MAFDRDASVWNRLAKCQVLSAECYLYRFAWPRASFLTLGFFDPRG